MWHNLYDFTFNQGGWVLLAVPAAGAAIGYSLGRWAQHYIETGKWF